MSASFTITRDKLVTDGPTLGVLIAGGTTFQTLELPWKDNHQRQSCIPTGSYPVVMKWSPRFQRKMPLILGVPFRSDILIHPGNDDGDTEGCVLIGAKRGFGILLPPTRPSSDQFNAWMLQQTQPIIVDISYATEGEALPRPQQIS